MRTLLTLVSACCLSLATPQFAYAGNLGCSQLLQRISSPQVQGVARTLSLQDLLLSSLGQSIWIQSWLQKEIRSAINPSKEVTESFRDGVSHITELHFSQQNRYAENFILDVSKGGKDIKDAL